MKIGIDVYSFDRPGDNSGVGPGVYVWHLLPKLFEYGKGVHFYVFGNRENEALIPRGENVSIIIDRLPNHIRSTRIIHEQIVVPYYVKKYDLDLIHYLGNNISFLAANRSILTIYDLMWKYYLDLGHNDSKLKYFNWIVPRSIRRAKGIITISSFVRQQVHEDFGKSLDRIVPVLLAPCTLRQPGTVQTNSYGEEYHYHYILTVTTSLPHKNLMTLIRAFQQIKLSGKYSGKLLIVGQLKGEYHSAVKEFTRENNLDQDIIQAGFVSEELKTYFYTNADFVVYPSFYEGFGLPVLEAMSVGNAVIASAAASIPEVGGQLCLYFDPHSIDELVEKMVFLLDHPEWKNDHRHECMAHAAKFSWDKTARETLAAYNVLS